jgi:hypothetical protein
MTPPEAFVETLGRQQLSAIRSAPLVLGRDAFKPPKRLLAKYAARSAKG